MAGASQRVPHDSVPDASTTTRIVQQVGGAFGAAVLAVVLARQLAGPASSGGSAAGAAFDVAFWWAIGFGVLALLTALLLRGRPAGRGQPGNRGRRPAVRERQTVPDVSLP